MCTHGSADRQGVRLGLRVATSQEEAFVRDFTHLAWWSLGRWCGCGSWSCVGAVGCYGSAVPRTETEGRGTRRDEECLEMTVWRWRSATK